VVVGKAQQETALYQQDLPLSGCGVTLMRQFFTLLWIDWQALPDACSSSEPFELLIGKRRLKNRILLHFQVLHF
jgi:hypothetical protein